MSRNYLAKRLAAERGIPYTRALRVINAGSEENEGVRIQQHPRPDVDPLAQPDRVAVAGDWHGNAVWAYDAISHAIADGLAQTILHTGDFGYLFHQYYLRTLDKALEAACVPLLFVDGNHEDHKWLARQPVDDRGLRRISDWVWHLPRGFRWTWHGLRFVALGGAHSVDGIWRRQQGLLWQREERITDEQANDVIAVGPAEVLVTHDCPAGVTIPSVDDRDEPSPFPQIELLRADEHRQILRRVVDTVQPRRIWHGHYHVCYQSVADFGYGPVQVIGLDRDGTTFARNIQLWNLRELARELKETAAA